jgi:hypothetical protein
LVARDPVTSAGDGSAPATSPLESRLLPALAAAVEVAGDPELKRAEVLALARAESSFGEGSGRMTTSIAAPFFLAQPKSRGVGEASIVALGLRARPESVDLLSDLVLDSALGRAAVCAPKVDHRLRAFAGYALGLVAEANGDLALRTRIARVLIDALAADPNAPYDVQLALLVSLGLTPLANCAETPPDAARVGHLCRGTELSFLLDFAEDTSRHPRLRAQAVVPLARLEIGRAHV